jgi:hypothetical protein
LVVQVFTPIAEGLATSLQLGQVLLDGFEGEATPNGVWFRNVRYTQIGDRGEFKQANFIADLEFDQVK